MAVVHHILEVQVRHIPEEEPLVLALVPVLGKELALVVIKDKPVEGIDLGVDTIMEAYLVEDIVQVDIDLEGPLVADSLVAFLLKVKLIIIINKMMN